MANKYHAVRTWSELCGRWFASKAECRRGEELRMLELAGEITDLEYQPKFKLCDKPKITYSADFIYEENGKVVVEDVKGKLLRETRVKLVWLKEKYNVEVILSK